MSWLSWDAVQKSKQRFTEIRNRQKSKKSRIIWNFYNAKNWLVKCEIILTKSSNPDLSVKSRTDSDSQLRQNWKLRLSCWQSKNQNNDWRLDLKSPEWKSQIGKDLTNLQLGSKRNFGTRKSENLWNFESEEFFRKNLNNLNKNWMLQISEYSTNPESGKNVSSSYNFFIFHFRFVD